MAFEEHSLKLKQVEFTTQFLEEEVRDLVDTHNELWKKLNLFFEENKDLKTENLQQKEHIQRLESDVEDLQKRLSEEILKGVIKDSNLEAVSSRNRPLTLRDRYEEICSGEWLEVKEYLDDNMATPEGLEPSVWDRIKCELLCSVFQESLNVCCGVKRNMMAALKSPVRNWAQRNKDQFQNDSCEGPRSLSSEFQASYSSVAGEVKQPLLEHHIANASDVRNVELMTKTVLANTGQNYKECVPLSSNPDTGELPETLTQLFTEHTMDGPIWEFVHAVCKLCWAMVVQHVPMTFDVTSGIGEPMNKHTQKVYYDCSENGKVVCYVYPVLYHGDHVLQQGTVLTEAI